MTADPTLAVITYLKANTNITAKVGTRIYRAVLPAKPTFPAITVTEISDISDDDSNTSHLAHTRVQCTSWTDTGAGQAIEISRLIRNAMHGIYNTSLTADVNKLYVVSIQDAGARPDVNTDVSPKVWMYHRDLMIEYQY